MTARPAREAGSRARPAREAGSRAQPAREAGSRAQPASAVRRRRWPRFLLALGLPVLVVLALVVMVPTSPPPARAAAVFTGLGFDTCAAPDQGTMQGWLSSPYRAIGIYIGGANRACGDGNLSAGWVNTVQAQGWKLAPLYVGLQAWCVNQGGLATISTDVPTASGQGTQAADDAAQRASNFGLGPGTPIYYDMEAYGSGCTDTTLAFEDAWTNELHRLGLVAGIYGSSASTIHDLANANPNVPDDIWFAAWNGSTSVFGDPDFPDSAWPNHQRLHQYQGDTRQTFGGVSLDIDLDSVDGALTGVGAPNCQTFTGPVTGSHQVCGAILAKYLSLGGPFLLGYPTTDETPTPDGIGRFNHFVNNVSIYWTPFTGAWSIGGAIRAKWASMGWERSILGYPTTDENGTPDKIGRFNYFSSHGAIYWTPNTGAWSIHGKVLDKWASMGWETSVLGYPVTDEGGTPDGIGRFNYFSNHGAIYWTPGTGAWSIHGAILDRWASLGWETSVLGYPTTDENTTPDKIGRYNYFSGHGAIYWTPSTGAWSIHGAILDKWASMGWETSVLGYPITDEDTTPNNIGRFNYFSGHGAIYWTPDTGAWSIHGAILDKWASFGWENSFLGFPVTDEDTTPDKIGRFNYFTGHGAIYWTPDTGAWSIHGAILDKWASMGWERSCLGYPVSDEFAIQGGRQSTLQHGDITYSFGTLQATSTC